MNSPLQKEVGSSAFKVYNQGVDLMHAKKFAEAQIKFEQAIRDNPNFAEAHNNLGFTLRQQGPQNYSKALEHYNKAIQLKPTMAETYEYRGVLFAKMGKKTGLVQFPWEINRPSEVQSSRFPRNSAPLRPLKVEAGINGLLPTSWVPSIYSVSLLIRLRYALER